MVITVGGIWGSVILGLCFTQICFLWKFSGWKVVLRQSWAAGEIADLCQTRLAVYHSILWTGGVNLASSRLTFPLQNLLDSTGDSIK
jgi:hypothetical protein